MKPDNSSVSRETPCAKQGVPMKIKEQTRKLAAGCSKHCFEVVDGS
ncbi:hypothetical protein OLC55_06375 [Streptococcus pneumoniae]|nr:hypothetical protein [Streptococcus pneumoniae]MBW5036404.1 hypothetical protein [Streptococcus pneumoniae]MBW5040629.1 hypothetical protein [Streptococcus pneumoniae]MBW5093946.1 hypothetical protein [Streptococcus pneumoniae]MBW5105687.1 hypothetical protein [Streptococcus pneumoniae]MBW5216553.1 hypothetical protein [Streptococcus pneumoniae]